MLRGLGGLDARWHVVRPAGKASPKRRWVLLRIQDFSARRGIDDARPAVLDASYLGRSSPPAR